MQWVIGILGGLTGGLLALLGGFLADRRTRRTSRHERIRALAAEYIAAVRILQIQLDAAHKSHASDTRFKLDVQGVATWEAAVIRTGAEIQWLTGQSEIRRLTVECDSQLEALRGAWSADSRTFDALYTKIARQSQVIEDALNAFERSTPRKRDRDIDTPV